eukprot:gene43676-54263_t
MGRPREPRLQWRECELWHNPGIGEGLRVPENTPNRPTLPAADRRLERAVLPPALAMNHPSTLWRYGALPCAAWGGWLRMMVSLRLPWPLPALLAWAAAWLLFITLRPVVPMLWAMLLPCLLGTVASLLGESWWRRGLIAAGFPLSLALTGMVTLPAWAWLVPLALLLLVYPLNAWRDAPLFPTPRHALQALAVQAPLPANAKVLDAGCGLGDGLLALRHAYPDAVLHGIEWSWLLRVACALR